MYSILRAELRRATCRRREREENIHVRSSGDLVIDRLKCSSQTLHVWQYMPTFRPVRRRPPPTMPNQQQLSEGLHPSSDGLQPIRVMQLDSKIRRQRPLLAQLFRVGTDATLTARRMVGEDPIGVHGVFLRVWLRVVPSSRSPIYVQLVRLVVRSRR